LYFETPISSLTVFADEIGGKGVPHSIVDPVERQAISKPFASVRQVTVRNEGGILVTAVRDPLLEVVFHLDQPLSFGL
jgi:hypothetical protein